MVGGNMVKSFIRRIIVDKITEKGQVEGAPIVNFLEREISVEGEDMYVGQGWLEWLFWLGGFYLALPANTYGVVVFPDGTSHNLKGGLHEVPAGVYQVYYVDKHERTDTSAPVSEMTTDGEKLTLQVILRYRVDEPVLALSIAHPVETLMEHIETDVAQYIRTHDHGDIADSSDKQDSKLFAFFSERHSRRKPLSDAISITGIELKDFTGDREYVEMRRKARMDERQNQIERQQAEYQQELNRLKALHKADNERLAAEHSASLARYDAEHKAEKEKIEAHHEKEMQDILHEVNLRKIKLDDKSKHLQRREEEFLKAIDAISSSFSSGYPTNPNVIATMTELVAALKEGVDDDEKSGSEPTVEENTSSAGNNRSTKPRAVPEVTDKVEKLTNTLLNLLNPKNKK
jgi:hypothetical protein